MNDKIIRIIGAGMAITGNIALTSSNIANLYEIYRTRKELRQTKLKLALTEIDAILKNAEIRRLEKELAELKSKLEMEEES